MAWCAMVLASSYIIVFSSCWAWIIVFLFAIVGVITIFQALRPVDKPDYVLYVEDDIHGAKWRWGWIRNRLSNLCCYCPHCDAVIVYRYDLILEETHFFCENCRHSLIATIKGGNKSYAFGAVEREIDRRIRTGEYKKIGQPTAGEIE